MISRLSKDLTIRRQFLRRLYRSLLQRADACI